MLTLDQNKLPLWLETRSGRDGVVTLYAVFRKESELSVRWEWEKYERKEERKGDSDQ